MGRMEDLLSEVTNVSRHNEKRSWYDNLDGEARQYVDLVLAHARAGGAVNVAHLQRQLRNEYGETVSVTTLRRVVNEAREVE